MVCIIMGEEPDGTLELEERSEGRRWRVNIERLIGVEQFPFVPYLQILLCSQPIENL